MHLACIQGHVEIVKELFRVGHADINCCHKSYGTPLHCAAREGHVQTVAYLLLCKADIEYLEGGLRLFV